MVDDTPETNGHEASAPVPSKLPDPPIATEAAAAAEIPPAPGPGDKLANLLAMGDVTLADVAAALEPLMVQSAAKVLNSMKLGEAIERAIETKTIALGAEVKAALARIEARQAAVPTQPEAPVVAAASNGGGLVESLLPILAQKIIGVGSGMEGMAAMFKGMQNFMEMTAAMYQGPRLAAQKEIIDTMKGGYSIGLSTEQIIAGADKAVTKGLEGFVKPTT